MKLETKYDIGEHIWFVYENQHEVCIYDDYIAWVSYEDELLYGLKESCNDIKEEDVILYEDTESLINRIKKVMEEIREKEERKKEKKNE